MALWADLLGRDLVTHGLWLRLIDVPGALAARQYSCPFDMVIEVRDDLLPGNAGCWRLRAGDSGAASCKRTTAAADISVGVRELGGTRIGSLAAAGLVTEHRAGPLVRLSAAMTWDPAPWCPTTL